MADPDQPVPPGTYCSFVILAHTAGGVPGKYNFESLNRISENVGANMSFTKKQSDLPEGHAKKFASQYLHENR